MCVGRPSRRRKGVRHGTDFVAGHAQLWLGYGRWSRIVRIWPTSAAKNCRQLKRDKRLLLLLLSASDACVGTRNAFQQTMEAFDGSTVQYRGASCVCIAVLMNLYQILLRTT